MSKGLEYAQGGEFKKAEKSFDKLIKNNLAEKDYKKATEINTEIFDAYNNLENINNKKGFNLVALVYLTKTIKLNPNDSKYFYNRGISLLQLKKYEKAIVDFSSAIKINSGNIDACYNRAISYRFANENTKAINGFCKVIELNHKGGEAYDNRASIY